MDKPSRTQAQRTTGEAMKQTKRAWASRQRRLQRLADNGNLDAVSELGLLLLEGIQYSKKGCLVRRNLKKGLRLLKYAAESGEKSAFFPLACAFDCGSGVEKNEREALRWYHRSVKDGDGHAATNISTIYRDAGNLEMAFKWLCRARDMGDVDAAECVGYCYQLGIGVKQNLKLAEQAYRSVIKSKSKYITEWARQEAMYNCAVILIQKKATPAALREAECLLRRANIDDDYPQARKLLRSLEAGKTVKPCLCRATLAGNLAKRWCPIHGKTFQE